MWSSLPEYLGNRITDWVVPGRVLDVTPAKYVEFLEDYSDRHELLHAFNDDLAF